MLLDADLRPDLSHKGLVSQNTNGTWQLTCFRRVEINRRGAEIAGEICSILGFSGYSFFNVTRVAGGAINPRESSNEESDAVHFTKHVHSDFDSDLHFRSKRETDFNGIVEVDKRNGIYYEQFVSAPRSCPGLYLECVPHAKIPVQHLRPDGIEPGTLAPIPESTTLISVATTEDPVTSAPLPPLPPLTEAPTEVPVAQSSTEEPSTRAPDRKSATGLSNATQLGDENFAWNSIIFINGEMACSGILLSAFWILARAECLDEIDWNRDMVVAVFGLSGRSVVVQSPYEQMVRVDCSRRIENTNFILVHLFTAVQFNRQILPIMIPQEYF